MKNIICTYVCMYKINTLELFFAQTAQLSFDEGVRDFVCLIGIVRGNNFVNIQILDRRKELKQ